MWHEILEIINPYESIAKAVREDREQKKRPIQRHKHVKCIDSEAFEVFAMGEDCSCADCDG